MAKSNIDGIATKGKTSCKNYGNDGPKKGLEGGGTGAPKGVSTAALKKVGHGIARLNNQMKRGK
jgi:hypothetical protein